MFFESTEILDAFNFRAETIQMKNKFLQLF